MVVGSQSDSSDAEWQRYVQGTSSNASGAVPRALLGGLGDAGLVGWAVPADAAEARTLPSESESQSSGSDLVPDTTTLSAPRLLSRRIRAWAAKRLKTFHQDQAQPMGRNFMHGQHPSVLR